MLWVNGSLAAVLGMQGPEVMALLKELAVKA
jgi:hypothetical protein